MKYLFNIFIAIDQLGNTIAGGNPDNTISGRVGYFSNHANTKARWYWIAMRTIINFAFFPVDGFNHCDQAYHKEELETYYNLKGVFFFIMSVFIIPICIIITILLYTLQFFKFIFSLLS